ncbi:drug resistance transporter [Paenibacillus pini JCM 16418]|uniref:Drug resistance transporter n=1 Tax=Paenibacillus pini JCM 16418 TaxID=1236976 RepID=W7YFU4_9BACL|nr:drug resistance transporter [Paenibacillus pini JCM 16418]
MNRKKQENQQLQASQSTIGDKPSTSRLWMIIILGALSAFGPLSLDMYLPALPDMTTTFLTTTSLTQLSLTSCLIGLAVGQLFAGPLSDVKGRRIPLLIGMLLYGVAQ